ncbi:V protein [Nariva virus]|uniref:Non-structural protein V n=1 Tax=Nariva virus TaxID=590647 RepID=B8XH60_9MONO|nr:V protein [Nariva virus]ACL97355.1 V protein [Nariva virus]
METNGQKVIRDALQVLAVVKETDSPTTENQCGRRLSVQGVTTQTSTTDPETKGESGSEEESGSGWGGEGNSSQEASGSNQLVDNAERYGEGESKGPQGPGGFDGVHDSPVRQDHPDEGIRREPCYVLLGAASGGAYLSESEGEGSPTRGSPVGESGDAKVIAPPNRGSTINDNPSCDDVKESLGFISQPKPRRLTGIDTSTDTGTPIPPPRDYTKRGHRREYSLTWTDCGFLVESWCNPVCARVTPLPRRESCKCGKCPVFCPECVGPGVSQEDIYND